MLCALAVGLMPLVEDDQWRKRPERVAQRSLDLLAPKAAFLLIGVQIREAFEQMLLRFDVVLGWEKVLKAAAVLENLQRLLCLPIRRRKHEHQNDQIFLHVLRRKAVRLFENQRVPAAGEVKVLAIRMIPILQVLNRLPVNLRGWHDPQHKPGLPFPIDHVHKINSS